MKLHCNHCDTQLTTDIYPTTEWRVDRQETDDDQLADYSILPGTFIDHTPIIMVNPDNVVIPIPDYERGMGCCNISHTPVHCPGCGQMVAEANLDYWQTKAVDFDMTICDKVILNENSL